MTQKEVDSFLEENKISVSVMMEHGFDKDGDWAEEILDDKGYRTGFGDDCVRIEKMWGFSSPNGFHTFEFENLTEIQAQYMTVLFHKLYEEYDTDWNSAEVLAYSYVKTCDVPFMERPPMTEEEQEAVREQLLGCIKSGNVVIPDEVKEYTNKVSELEKEDLFTKSAIIEDWKPDKEYTNEQNI